MLFYTNFILSHFVLISHFNMKKFYFSQDKKVFFDTFLFFHHHLREEIADFKSFCFDLMWRWRKKLLKTLKVSRDKFLYVQIIFIKEDLWAWFYVFFLLLWKRILIINCDLVFLLHFGSVRKQNGKKRSQILSNSNSKRNLFCFHNGKFVNDVMKLFILLASFNA